MGPVGLALWRSLYRLPSGNSPCMLNRGCDTALIWCGVNFHSFSHIVGLFICLIKTEYQMTGCVTLSPYLVSLQVSGCTGVSTSSQKTIPHDLGGAGPARMWCGHADLIWASLAITWVPTWQWKLWVTLGLFSLQEFRVCFCTSDSFIFLWWFWTALVIWRPRVT